MVEGDGVEGRWGCEASVRSCYNFLPPNSNAKLGLRYLFLSMRRLLEVGALKPDNYASCTSWLDVTPIDLRSRHPLIREQDFLEMDVEENEAKWDIISLSLVVNFVPERKDRGEFISCLF